MQLIHKGLQAKVSSNKNTCKVNHRLELPAINYSKPPLFKQLESFKMFSPRLFHHVCSFSLSSLAFVLVDARRIIGTQLLGFGAGGGGFFRAGGGGFFGGRGQDWTSEQRLEMCTLYSFSAALFPCSLGSNHWWGKMRQNSREG